MTPPPSTQGPGELPVWTPGQPPLLHAGKARPCLSVPKVWCSPSPLSCRPALTRCPQVQRALLSLTLSLEKLQAVKCRMLEAMEKGLSQETHAQATVHMLPTFICSTPDGTGEAARWGDVLLCCPQPCAPRRGAREGSRRNPLLGLLVGSGSCPCVGTEARSRLPGALRWSQEGNCCFPGVGVTASGRGADRGLVSA